MKRCVLSIFILLLILLPFELQAQGIKNQCLICGMDLNQYTHVRYQVTDNKGNIFTTCGVQCGLILQLNLKDTFKSATATDLFSHRTIPASKAWFVYHSSIITDMGPGFIAFANRDTAQRFIKGFGGELLNYQSSLQKIKNGLE